MVIVKIKCMDPLSKYEGVARDAFDFSSEGDSIKL